MRILLVILCALLLAVLVGILASHDTGHVMISVSGWSMQTSLVLFLALLLVLFFAVYAGVRLLIRLLSAPATWRHWRRQRRQHLSEKYLVGGLLALLENRARDAEEALVKGARYTLEPVMHFLCAARAAQRQGRIKERDQYLEQAVAANPDAKIANGLTRAELLLDQKQADMALAILTGLYREYPAHKQLRLLLLRAYMELQMWQDTLILLPSVARSGLLDWEKIEALRITAYSGKLQKAGAIASRTRLEEAWHEIPWKARRAPGLIKVYTLEKLKFANTADCERLLQRALENGWGSELINLYGLVEGRDATRQLAFAEGFTETHADDAWLWLALGRLCLRNSLWGKAQTYLKRSLELNPMPETCHELARFHEKQGDYSAASGYY
ncbi:MAG: heme biosynthesis HemY N-terminal domain-containing protein, partial [Gammaproteobacteria bacterium]